MKKFIDDVSLLDLIPFNFKNDEDTLNVLKSINYMLKKFIQNIPEVILFDRIDELEEWKIDELALDLHVDYYKSDLQIQQKKELLKTSLITHRTKGTPFAVEKITSILFGNGEVKEWFEFGGNPGEFKVTTQGELETIEDYYKVIEAINEYKNVRSWLKAISFERKSIDQLHYGTVSVIRNKVILI